MPEPKIEDINGDYIYVDDKLYVRNEREVLEQNDYVKSINSDLIDEDRNTMTLSDEALETLMLRVSEEAVAAAEESLKVSFSQLLNRLHFDVAQMTDGTAADAAILVNNLANRVLKENQPPADEDEPKISEFDFGAQNIFTGYGLRDGVAVMVLYKTNSSENISAALTEEEINSIESNRGVVLSFPHSKLFTDHMANLRAMWGKYRELRDSPK